MATLGLAAPPTDRLEGTVDYCCIVAQAEGFALGKRVVAETSGTALLLAIVIRSGLMGE